MVTRAALSRSFDHAESRLTLRDRPSSSLQQMDWEGSLRRQVLKRARMYEAGRARRAVLK
eukprot:scaffold803_cov310-Pinguiococcus_pyrenoidosus.AAC.207